MSAPLTTRDALAKWFHDEGHCYPWLETRCDCAEQADALLASGALTDAGQLAEDEALVERVTALAGKWNSTPDYNPTEYDRGRVDQRHAMTAELLEALSAQSERAEVER